MRTLLSRCRRWYRRLRPYRPTPWPQPRRLHPWLDDQRAAPQRIAAALQAGRIDTMTADRLHFWHENGYLILPSLIDDARIDRIRADFERFHAEGTLIGGHRQALQRGPHNHFQPVINVHMQSEAIRDVFLDPVVMKWVRLILGRDVFGCQSIHFFSGSQRALHQDHIHMTTRPYGYLAAAWFALEDVSPEAGPLKFVPGSQWLPYLDVNRLQRHLRPGQHPDAVMAELLRAEFRRRGLKPQTFIARKGDVLLWHANLIHGGARVVNPARSRLSMACHYAAQGVEYFHELSGMIRDPANDLLRHQGQWYLPEYHHADGQVAPTKREWLQRQDVA